MDLTVTISSTSEIQSQTKIHLQYSPKHQIENISRITTANLCQDYSKLQLRPVDLSNSKN